MAPRVKHTYKSSNNRRSLTLHEKESTTKDLSLLQSYTSSNVRAQQEQVQKMKSDLQARERKILQDITNLSKAPPPRPLKIPESYKALSEQILPDDINDRISFTIPEDVPSFVASPIIFKETSFNQPIEGDSFIIIEKSRFGEFNFPEDNLLSPKGTSSSPNKVPVTSDLPTSETGSVFDYYETENVSNHPIEEEEYFKLEISESSKVFASPISDKSISRPSEIELFTIDPEFLHSFEGIWRRKLDHPVRAADPESPDHFEQIPMVSKGAPRTRKIRR